MNKFRPSDVSTKYTMRQRRIYGKSDSFNWQTRVEWFPVGYGINKRTIAKQFRRLHYLACHSPKAVAIKWIPVYNQFSKKLFAEGGKASIRYLNNRTGHSWL